MGPILKVVFIFVASILNHVVTASPCEDKDTDIVPTQKEMEILLSAYLPDLEYKNVTTNQ